MRILTPILAAILLRCGWLNVVVDLCVLIAAIEACKFLARWG